MKEILIHSTQIHFNAHFLTRLEQSNKYFMFYVTHFLWCLFRLGIELLELRPVNKLTSRTKLEC